MRSRSTLHAPRRRAAIARTLAALAIASLATTADAGERANAGASTAPPPAPIRIELRPSVEVHGPKVSLGDVAVITTHDLPLLERLMAVPLGLAPVAGGAARLDRATLARWVRARTGVDLAAVEWAGPTATTVRTALQMLDGAQLAQRAAEVLRAALPSRGRVEIEPRAGTRDVRIPAGRAELRARPLTQAALLATHPTVWVDVSVDGRFVQTVPVSFDVREFGAAWVATEKLRPGERIDATKVALREVERRGVEILPPDPAALERLRVRRPVAAGAPLTPAQVEPAPLVRRGAFATLEARTGPMQVECRVEVLEDGRSGETVRVRPPHSTGIVLARVTGPDRLEVQP
jgi:flagella basal body P-ring formation protein FlgA